MSEPQEANSPRECGQCTACCTVMAVSALEKPAGTPCVHLCEGGCSVYADRPTACHDWYCLWVRDNGHLLNETHRPDKLGLLFTATKPDDYGRQMMQAREVEPLASTTPQAQQVIAFIKQFVPLEIVPFKQPSVTATPLTIDGKPL